ncbi:MAG TPA: hypothetical protein VME68_03405 [Acidobacteriaceae bacterium]|nr:hypothetical protein [Acidobacteriaceae bacterium]
MTTSSFKTTLGGSGLRLCALFIAALLVLEPVAPAQAQVSAAAEPPRSLQIIILDGEGALNNIQERTAREPIVQVQDHNHKPVAGASLLFAIHGGADGASGSFAGGASTLSVTTDANGIGRAVGLSPNTLKGGWQIEVTATLGTLTATTLINEMNVPPTPSTATPTSNAVSSPPLKPPSHHIFTKPITITGSLLIAGAVIAITVVELQGNGPTKITTGTGNVGPPGTGASTGGIRIRF